MKLLSEAKGCALCSLRGAGAAWGVQLGEKKEAQVLIGEVQVKQGGAEAWGCRLWQWGYRC